MIRKLLIMMFLFGVLTAGGAWAFSAIRSTIETGEVHARAEQKIGKILGTEVRVGEMRYRFFRSLSLAKLKIKKGILLIHPCLNFAYRCAVSRFEIIAIFSLSCFVIGWRLARSIPLSLTFARNMNNAFLIHPLIRFWQSRLS